MGVGLLAVSGMEAAGGGAVSVAGMLGSVLAMGEGAVEGEVQLAAKGVVGFDPLSAGAAAEPASEIGLGVVAWPKTLFKSA